MQESKTTNPTASKDQPSRGQWLKGLSIAGSIAVVLWSFSGVLQKSSVSIRSVGPAPSVPVDPVDKVTRQQPDSSEFREAAIVRDRAFMESIARKSEAELSQPKPGPEEIAPIWKQKTDRIRRQIDELASAEEGSLQWANRQELITKLEDLPE